MAYQPLTLERFAGLNLLGDPGEIGLTGAIDVLNVELDKRGRARQRDGYDKFTAAQGTYRYRYLWNYGASTHVIAEQKNSPSDTWLIALSSAGAVLASQDASPYSGRFTFANIGILAGPTTGYTYATPRDGGTIWRWDGTTWTAPGAMPNAGGYLTLMPMDNRLVNAQPGTDGKVAFSDAGDPETWGANNFVELNPGDGEPTTAAATWRELVFVFKRSKFFVFYGNSTDGTGQPVFNYRPVVGAGCVGGNAVAAGVDGLYFLSDDGVYRTTGGAPQKISGALDPLFGRGSLSAFYQGGSAVNSQAGTHVLCWHRNRLYVSLAIGAGATANSRLAVWDPDTGDWTLWDIPAAGMTSFYDSSIADFRLLFSYATGLKHIGRYAAAATDDGSNIAARYRTGFFEPGGQPAESTIREAILDGIGTVAVKGSTNWGSLGAATNVTLGTSPATIQGRARVAQRGRQHSYEFSTVSGGAWTLNEATFNVRGARGPGLKSA